MTALQSQSPPTAPPPTAPTAPPPQRASSGTAATLGTLSPILAARVVINAVAGFGKTSMIAFAEIPVILCAEGETGYQTLLGANLVPEIPGAVIDNWPAFLATLDTLETDCPYKTVAIDAAGGFEGMCFSHVGTRDFKSNMGPKGFWNYAKGPDVAARDWCGMLLKLDKIHAQGVDVVILSHCQDKTIQNPLGEDYAKYVGSIHKKVWAATTRWADAVLFGKFVSIVDEKKGIGGTDRVLYCEHRDAYDAKNRFNMPAQINIPGEPAQVWSTITATMKRKDT